MGRSVYISHWDGRKYGGYRLAHFPHFPSLQFISNLFPILRRLPRQRFMFSHILLLIYYSTFLLDFFSLYRENFDCLIYFLLKVQCINPFIIFPSYLMWLIRNALFSRANQTFEYVHATNYWGNNGGGANKFWAYVYKLMQLLFYAFLKNGFIIDKIFNLVIFLEGWIYKLKFSTRTHRYLTTQFYLQNPVGCKCKNSIVIFEKSKNYYKFLLKFDVEINYFIH